MRYLTFIVIWPMLKFAQFRWGCVSAGSAQARAVQFCLRKAISECVVEVECIDIEFAGDVRDAIGPQDVDGEAAKAGEVSGLDAGSAGVFAERDVADVVAAIFYCPVAADRLGERLGVEFDLAGG